MDDIKVEIPRIPFTVRSNPHQPLRTFSLGSRSSPYATRGETPLDNGQSMLVGERV